MNKTVYGIIIGTLLLLWAVFILPKNELKQPERASDLPWQITYTADSLQVFGITIGQTTLDEATRALKSELELAWFHNPDNSYNLEAFYRRVTLSGLQAKVVLELDKGNYSKEYFGENSGKPELLQSKSIKYPLADLVETLSQQKVLSIAYIPKISLDEALIKSRFGEPREVINVTENRQHWLYPEKGLDIAVNKDGKEVLQYIDPNNFSRLLKKIEEEQNSAQKEQNDS